MSDQVEQSVRGVLVPVDGPARVVHLQDDGDRDLVYELIGGTDHEVLSAAGASVFYDYEARAQPDNLAVARAFANLGEPLELVPPGPVLVVGRANQGNWTDCPRAVRDALVG